MPSLDRFLDRLPIPATLAPHTVEADGTSHYRIIMKAGAVRVHPQLPQATPIWGYNGTYPGPIVETPYDKAVVVHFRNELQGKPPSAIEHGHQSHVFLPDKPWTVIHLHGSPTPPSSDGWSDDAFFPLARSGAVLTTKEPS